MNWIDVLPSLVVVGVIAAALGYAWARHDRTGAEVDLKPGWAELLARVFAIDVKKCGHCGGELKIVAAIMAISAIRKILGHLGLPDKPPDIAPARLPAQMSFA